MTEATEGPLEGIYSKGFVKLHRELLDSPVFQDPHLLQLYVWLKLSAQHKTSHVPIKVGENGTRVVTLQAGQLITGRSRLADYFGWKESTCRDRLSRLESMGLVSIQPDRQFSIVSITNWQAEQSSQSTKTTGDRQPDDRRPTTEQQATDNHATGDRQPADTYKKAKKVKKAEEGREASERAPARPETLLTLKDALQYGATIAMAANVVESCWLYYEQQGWVTSKGRPIKDRRAALKRWHLNESKFATQHHSGTALSAIARPAGLANGLSKGEQNAMAIFNHGGTYGS